MRPEVIWSHGLRSKFRRTPAFWTCRRRRIVLWDNLLGRSCKVLSAWNKSQYHTCGNIKPTWRWSCRIGRRCRKHMDESLAMCCFSDSSQSSRTQLTNDWNGVDMLNAKKRDKRKKVNWRFDHRTQMCWFCHTRVTPVHWLAFGNDCGLHLVFRNDL